MKTQEEQIAYHKQQLEKILKSHGAESEAFTAAFFRLQAAMMGMPIESMFDWANAETERLHKIALEQL